MELMQQFSKELLDAPIEDRVNYFIEKKIKHKHLVVAYQKLIKALNKGDPCQLIIVYGATGVGKTTLCDRIEKGLRDHTNVHPGCIPVARIEALAPSSGSFDWREYYRRGLEALNEALVERKLDPRTVFDKRKKNNTTTFGRKPSASELRNALEKAFYYRDVLAFVVDEAQHLRKVISGRNLTDQMDSIKSMANTTGVKHVLSGTYELIGLTDLSGQLNRRSTEIHLPRYRYNIEDELEEFINVLVNLGLLMPLKKPPQFNQYIDEIYEGTAGCVGILKDWLTRSLILALDENDQTVTMDHLMATKIPDRQMSRIAREINEGEMQLYVDKTEEIRSMLGMVSMKPRNSINANKPGKKCLKPGERQAKRDAVGRGEAGA